MQLQKCIPLWGNTFQNSSILTNPFKEHQWKTQQSFLSIGNFLLVKSTFSKRELKGTSSHFWWQRALQLIRLHLWRMLAYVANTESQLTAPSDILISIFQRYFSVSHLVSNCKWFTSGNIYSASVACLISEKVLPNSSDLKYVLAAVVLVWIILFNSFGTKVLYENYVSG